jgi:hypothetical protein
MAFTLDGSRPVYMHTINKLRNARTGDFFQAMESDCLPLYKKHGAELYACWESAPGQGIGHETVEIWELKSFDVYSKFVAAAHSPHGDKRFRKWFEKRAEWIDTMDNMLCIAHPNAPTLADFKKKKVKAKVAIHEMVTTKPSQQLDYLDAIYRMWWPVAEKAGRSLLGLLYSPWNNRRAINIWGLGETWDKLPIMGKADAYQSDAFQLWMTMGHALREDWNDRFLIPAPFAPVR